MSTTTIDSTTMAARKELLKFFRATVAEGIEGSPSRALDEYWHAWLEDAADYDRTCQAGTGVIVGHRASAPSLARYEAARSAIRRRFGHLDPLWWPDLVDVALVADCHDYIIEKDPPAG
jgi:hypothetical protein